MRRIDGALLKLLATEFHFIIVDKADANPECLMMEQSNSSEKA